jgi:hypothetical protein
MATTRQLARTTKRKQISSEEDFSTASEDHSVEQDAAQDASSAREGDSVEQHAAQDCPVAHVPMYTSGAVSSDNELRFSPVQVNTPLLADTVSAITPDDVAHTRNQQASWLRLRIKGEEQARIWGLNNPGVPNRHPFAGVASLPRAGAQFCAGPPAASLPDDNDNELRFSPVQGITTTASPNVNGNAITADDVAQNLSEVKRVSEEDLTDDEHGVVYAKK